MSNLFSQPQQQQQQQQQLMPQHTIRYSYQYQPFVPLLQVRFFARKATKAEKRQKKLEKEPHVERLRLRLQTEHGMSFSPLHVRKTPMDEKWAKKGWKLALVLHRKQRGQDCADIMKDQKFSQQAEKVLEKKSKRKNREKSVQAVVFTRAEKQAQRGELEQKTLLRWKKMVVQALEERGESTDGNNGELFRRLQESVLKEGGEEEFEAEEP
jgi:hypothetical protein